MASSLSSHVNVIHCSQCQGDTEYNCLTCGANLCPKCKRIHTIDLDTIDHDVLLYKEIIYNRKKDKHKINFKNEFCAKHRDQVIEMHCESCKTPICFNCRKHVRHKLLTVRKAYEKNREQSKKFISNIRSEILYNLQCLRAGLKTDVSNDNTCSSKDICQLNSAIENKAQKLKESIDKIQIKLCLEYKCFLIKQLCNQMKQIKGYLTKVQKYENRHDQSANKPIQFLRFVKSVRLPNTPDTLRLTKQYLPSVAQKIDTENLSEILCCMKITQGEKRQAKKERLLTRMPALVLQGTYKVKELKYCRHMSFVESDQLWISDSVFDRKQIILIDLKTGDILHSVTDCIRSPREIGFHTVNNNRELIYIDSALDISKLSEDRNSCTKLIKRTDSFGEARCVYSSIPTGELLVGTEIVDKRLIKGMVCRYDNSGQLINTISYNNNIYRYSLSPRFIIENHNGDVVFSSSSVVKVTGRDDKHRFIYRGPPSNKYPISLTPEAVCVDALSNILVCDEDTKSIQIIDKDGNFLSFLLRKLHPDIQIISPHTPYSLCYDNHRHLLFVGAWAHVDEVSVYRYINRDFTLLGKYTSRLIFYCFKYS